ncbi:hypothetical protein ACH5RR_028948 [Cinchona calisaya]|uniref:Uncharacterized protein n=1 Tax=Cinchona calisaya TaxID=153742 RepID=A0ABD2YQ87_9GENT
MNTAMIDVADELGVPTYLFYTSGAALLGLMFHFQTLEFEQNLEISELVKVEKDLVIPSFANPVPVSVLQNITTNKEIWSTRFLKAPRAYRRVNTFFDLESHALRSFSLDSSYGMSRLPPIYPVGPILNSSLIPIQSAKDPSEMMNWLDCQPENSVVFLFFASIGSFHVNQVQEIAYRLERSGCQFIWVLRQPSAKKGGFASDYESPELILPKGFLD